MNVKSLRVRISAFNVSLALAGSFLMAFLCWQAARDALVDAAEERLQFAATARKTGVEQIFTRAKSDIAMLASNRDISNNFEDLDAEMDIASATRAGIIQTFTTPSSRAERMALDGRAQGGIYGARHAKLHDAAVRTLASGNYADVLLIDDKGIIIYTAAKGADFGKSLLDAGYGTTGLAKLITQLKASKSSVVSYQDFAPYPADASPSAFLAMPVTRKANAAMGTDQETLTIGYVALRLQPSILSALADREGLGATGQIFALGPDLSLISARPLDPSGHPGDPLSKVGLPPEAVSAGRPFFYTLDGQTERIAALAPVSVLGVQWKLVAERGKDEALLAVSSLTRVLLLCLVIVMVMTTVCGLLIARQVVRPITALVWRMRALSAGDVNSPIVGLDRADELGEMAKAVAIFRDNALALENSKSEAAAAKILKEQEAAFIEEERAAIARKQADVVTRVASALHRLASGDLLHRLESPFSTEYEQLRGDFNGAVETLQRTMADVLARTHAIQSGTNEIATASNDLSRRTEQQAANLEETAAALNEITVSVKKTATGAAHAREAVLRTTANAQHSGEIVARTVQAMDRIAKFSTDIGNIVGVIDEIAFQTNLLALNAGVEAARAGEAGRGFAVVASEVRALAQRSAEAAKEIKTLIAASEEGVKAGVLLVGETGRDLTEIIRQITDINLIIGKIAAAADQQATGIAEVNIAVKQMDQVTQQNAAMVEEATAATHSLSGDSEKLVEAVRRFKVAEYDTVAGHQPAGMTHRIAV